MLIKMKLVKSFASFIEDVKTYDALINTDNIMYTYINVRAFLGRDSFGRTENKNLLGISLTNGHSIETLYEYEEGLEMLLNSTNRRQAVGRGGNV